MYEDAHLEMEYEDRYVVSEDNFPVIYDGESSESCQNDGLSCSVFEGECTECGFDYDGFSDDVWETETNRADYGDENYIFGKGI